MSVADQHGDQVDGLSQQRARERDDGLLNELLHAAQRPQRGSGMDRADAAGNENISAGRHACPQRFGRRSRHDPRARIVVEREHRDRGLADGEGRRRDHGRQQSLEPLAAFGQLGGNARERASTSTPT